MRTVRDQFGHTYYVDDATGTVYFPDSEGGMYAGGNYNRDRTMAFAKPVSEPAAAPVAAAPVSPQAPAKPQWISASDPYFAQFSTVDEFGLGQNPYGSIINGLQTPELWQSVARQLGYQGPFEEQFISSDPGEGGGGYITGPATEFQQFIAQKKAEGYDFVVKGDEIGSRTKTFGLMTPTGEVVGQRPVKASGFEEFFKEFVLPVATTIIGIPGYGGEAIASLGNAVLPSGAAQSIGSALGISADAVTAAVGRGVVNAGLSAITGGDAGDVLKAGALPLAGAGVSNVVSSVVPSGLGPLEQAAERAITSGIMGELSGRQDFSDALVGSLAGSAAGALGQQAGLSPATSQALGQAALDLVTTGDVNLKDAFNAVTSYLSDEQKRQQQQQIQDAYRDPSRALDVIQPGPDVEAGLGDAGSGELMLGPLFSGSAAEKRAQVAEFLRTQVNLGAPGFGVDSEGNFRVDAPSRQQSLIISPSGELIRNPALLFSLRATEPGVDEFIDSLIGGDIYPEATIRPREEGGSTAGLIAVGDSANPPTEGGRPVFGSGSGSAPGDVIPISLIARDNGLGAGETDGFSVLLYSDGTTRVVPDDDRRVVMLDQLDLNQDPSITLEQAGRALTAANPPVSLPSSGVDTSGDYGQSVFDEIDRTLAAQEQQRAEDQRAVAQQQEAEQREAQEAAVRVAEQQERQRQEDERQAAEQVQRQEASVREAQEAQRRADEEATRQRELVEQQEFQRQEAGREYERLAEQEAVEAAAREAQRAADEATEFQRQEAEREAQRLAEQEAVEVAARAQQGTQKGTEGSAGTEGGQTTAGGVAGASEAGQAPAGGTAGGVLADIGVGAGDQFGMAGSTAVQTGGGTTGGGTSTRDVVVDTDMGTGVGSDAGTGAGANAGAGAGAGSGAGAGGAGAGTSADVGAGAGVSAGAGTGGMSQAEVDAAIARAGVVTQSDLDRAIAGITIPAGINRADVEDAISGYMRQNPGLSPQDVAQQVGDQLRQLPAYATPADVESAIQGAMTNVATRSDVEKAIQGIQFPAGISRADVTDVISDYMRQNPGLSPEDVAREVGRQLSALPTYATPSDVDAAINRGLTGYATSADVAKAGEDTGRAITGVETRLGDRIDELVRHGATYQQATDQAFQELTGTVSTIAERQAEETAARQAAEEERRRQLNLQLKQQQEQQMLGLGSSLQSKPASVVDPYKATFLTPFIVGGEAPKEFMSPLAAFLNEATGKPFLPERPKKEEPEKTQPLDFFATGENPLQMYEPAQEYTGLFGFRQGGMVPMAQGGTRHGENAHGALRVLEHSGKRRVDYRQGDAVTGIGDGQSDDIPAMLADGEFVIPADVVAALGNGSTKAGSDKLYDMMRNIRRHHRSTGPKDLPPPAKSPLEYIRRTR